MYEQKVLNFILRKISALQNKLTRFFLPFFPAGIYLICFHIFVFVVNLHRVELQHECTMHSSSSAKNDHERKFPVIREKSLQLICESAGFEVAENTCAVLAGDLNYRLRDLIHVRFGSL